jgi:hypothetical protein
MTKINENRLCLFRDAFSFLVDDFGFKEKSIELDERGIDLLFCNQTTGIRASYEPNEGGIFVMLIRLVDGELPDYPVFIDEDTTLNYFDLQDLLSVRVPLYEEDDFDIGQTDIELENHLKILANNLRTKAEDILKGDFVIFSKLEKLVKERARQLKDR